ncbi:MAG: gamma-glutamyl-gamma-aminobutyrate hydrolase family protein [Ruminiclostridium sp.]|nr:gamma-glutamyl-gamma-aminobutyrate hydrolase family protein [Ruminiclostridium sp.]
MDASRIYGRSYRSRSCTCHSGICELAPGLKCMASSPDGLIEAIWAPGQTFLWAVQWHPEFSYKINEDSKAIFAEFVRACRT